VAGGNLTTGVVAFVVENGKIIMLDNINSYGYNTGTGDLLVNISVYIPETLTKEERQALEKWQEAENFKPNTSLKEKIFKKFRSLFD
jgi:molecular chaperone DnaJ